MEAVTVTLPIMIILVGFKIGAIIGNCLGLEIVQLGKEIKRAAEKWSRLERQIQSPWIRGWMDAWLGRGTEETRHPFLRPLWTHRDCEGNLGQGRRPLPALFFYANSINSISHRQNLHGYYCKTIFFLSPFRFEKCSCLQRKIMMLPVW